MLQLTVLYLRREHRPMPLWDDAKRFCCLNNAKFGRLILSKIVKIVACTVSIEGKNTSNAIVAAAHIPLGELTALPQTP